MTAGECEAQPLRRPVPLPFLRRLGRWLPPRPHEGCPVLYVRVCGAGHMRAGYVCDACRGPYGTVLCGMCGKPALLIPDGAFREGAFLILGAAGG